MKKIAHHVKYHAGMIHSFAKQHITGISIAAFLSIVGFSACVAIDQSLAASMGKQTDGVLLSGGGNPTGGIKGQMPAPQISKKGDKNETWTKLPMPGGELNELTGSNTGFQTGGPKTPVSPTRPTKKGQFDDQIGIDLQNDGPLEGSIKPIKPTKTEQATKSDTNPIILPTLGTTTTTSTSVSTSSTTTTSIFSESASDFTLSYDKKTVAAISSAILKDMDKLITKLKINTSNTESFQAGVMLATKIKPALKKDFEQWSTIVSALPATSSDLKGTIKLDSASLRNILATMVQDMEAVSKRVRKVSSSKSPTNSVGSLKLSFYTDMMTWLQFKEQYSSSSK